MKDVSERLFAFDQDESVRVQGLVAGVDEAGRGPLAGPVVAAAVIFLHRSDLRFLNDSKQVTAVRREKMFCQIAAHSRVSIGLVDESTIDRINIYQATRAAMRQAVLGLTRTPDLILVDGNMTLDLPLRQRAIVKGDEKSAAIAAASIIAKVFRDAWMTNLDSLYPSYQFKMHKGYPTPAHLDALRASGPCPIHRFSFGPVRDCGKEMHL